MKFAATLLLIVVSAARTDAPASLYHEALRPQFHFSARQWTKYRLNPQQREEGWMNDPNGLIYYAGEYHLFAQRWAACWIHAVSPDLLHWTELPPAIHETSPGSGVQSGTAVIDWNDTSGLSPDPKNPPLVCFWPTWDNRTQNISYSLDHGRTFQPYAKNPVLVHGERDPKVFWYEPTKSWIMFLYDTNHYRIFTSPNLLAWTDTGNGVPNSHECPDVFQLPVDGNKLKLKWACVRGNGNYSLGDFDGAKFTETTAQMPSDSGPNFYATQTWNEMPDGRRVQVAWMSGGRYPGMPFNQQMTIPRELTLRTTPAGVRLFREPIAGLAKIHGTEIDKPAQTLASGAHHSLSGKGQCFHLQMPVTIPAGSTLEVQVNGTNVILGHDTVESGSKFTTMVPLSYVEIVADRTSLEVFANHGETSLSRCILPDRDGIVLSAFGVGCSVGPIKLWAVKSVWPENLVGPSATP